MYRYLMLALLACLAPIAGTLPAQETPDEPQLEITEQEQALQKLLTGSQLRGSFTIVDDQQQGEPPQLASEAYDLGEVKKLPNGKWLFQARIRYGEHDVTLPLTLPVEWAGDTPVVVVDNVGFPGLGTYSARVLFHGDRYAGYWQGADHGGHLFGTIARGDEAPAR